MDIEKLGAFYLGKELDTGSGELSDRPILYDARDLTTHALVVGMTGSGKTGLCVDLMEEAALDSVPAIMIDPKGDITNLLLTFPDLRPEDFKPWVNLDDARRKGLSVEEYAEKIADTWRKGLTEWGEGPERIRKLKESAEFLIFTPGSDAGIPVSVLSSLNAPKLNWEENQETLREQIAGTVSALLGLAGIEADPVRSREHILLSTIFENAWKEQRDLDMPTVIQAIQNPPVRKVGVFDVDTFFPPKDRFELAMALNNIVASPSFANWLTGEPLDVGRLLHNETGKPRMSIFYIAHLSDEERMFFVTLLLEEILSWIRTQPGTTSLRALLYFDEVFGFFPPVSNPPSKRPLLTLLKQARAFGLGVVLATQNPVDVDYKGLTNAGTWFVGRLQAKRDKERLLEGLEQAVVQSGQSLNRSEIDRLISSLKSRQFYVHNVHEEQPVLMTTRWAMSYLRGPLTRDQIRGLMKPVKKRLLKKEPQPRPLGKAPQAEETAAVEEPGAGAPPALPPEVRQIFGAVSVSAEQARRFLAQKRGDQIREPSHGVVYKPYLFAQAEVHFSDLRRNVEASKSWRLLLPAPQSPMAAAWEEAILLKNSERLFLDKPETQGQFLPVPVNLNDAKDVKQWGKALSEYLYRKAVFPLYHNAELKVYSEPGESLRDFKIRLKQLAREERDAAVDKLSEKYQRSMDRIEDRMRREERQLAKYEAKAKALTTEQWASIGESALSFLLGRRSSRVVSGALRKRRQVELAKNAVEESQAELQELAEDLKQLKEELEDKAKAIQERWDTVAEKVETQAVHPKRRDVGVQEVALAWMPFWEFGIEEDQGSVTLRVPAFDLPTEPKSPLLDSEGMT